MTTYALLKLLSGTDADKEIAKALIERNPEQLVPLTMVAHFAGASSTDPSNTIEFGGTMHLFNIIYSIYSTEEAEQKLEDLLAKIKEDHTKQKNIL